MDRTSLKRILMVYSIVLMVISGLAIVFGVIVFLISLLPLLAWIVPASTAYSMVGGGAILAAVGLLGFLATKLNGGERNTLISHMVGLVIVVIIQVYMTCSLLASHGSVVKDPLGIVINLFGYQWMITWFGKYFGLLVMLLTIPQIIALYVSVRIFMTKPSLLPTITFQR